MNKNLLTLAVAAALAAPAIAPSIASAEAIVYGKIHASLDYAEVKNVVLPTYEFATDANGSVIFDANGNPTLVKTANGEDFKGWGMSGNGYIPGVNRASRLGFKGSEDLGNGLKAIYQIEFGINLNDTNNNVLSNGDTISYRNTFVGLAGDWGTFLLGRHDTPMKISTGKLDLFSDTMADYNGTVGFRDLRADNVVAYISPSWSGFQLAAAFVPSGGATGGGNGLNLEEDSLADTYSIAAIYSNGPFYASAAFENLNSEHFNDQATALDGNNCPVVTDFGDGTYDADCGFQDSDAQAWRIGLGLLDWNGFSLTAVYENQDGFNNDSYASYVDTNAGGINNSWFVPGATDEAELWQIQAGYSFGNSMVKAMYGEGSYSSDVFLGANVVASNGGPIFSDSVTLDTDYDITTWAVGYDYSFSKRTKAYALYTVKDSDQKDFINQSEWSGFSLGMIHSF
jgi:predicted porin